MMSTGVDLGLYEGCPVPGEPWRGPEAGYDPGLAAH
jgi:hypothetical protein